MGTKSPRSRHRLRFAAEKTVTCEETLDQSEAAHRRALAGREHVLALHSADRLVRDVDALYRELRAARKAA